MIYAPKGASTLRGTSKRSDQVPRRAQSTRNKPTFSAASSLPFHAFGAQRKLHGRFRGNVAADETTPSICVQNREAGLSIDAKTGRCKWLGETMDYSQAIEGMQFRRDRALEAEQASRET